MKSMKRRIDWLLESPLSEGKTEAELKQNIIDMYKEDSYCIQNGLTISEWQFDELIPEYIEK